MRTSLSKSKYTRYCQCAKSLWLHENKPSEATIDKAKEAVFEKGNIIGDLAMGLFGDYTEVTSYDTNGNLNLREMALKTSDCIENGVDVICEASFGFSRLGSISLLKDENVKIKSDSRLFNEGHYCSVDILKKQGDGYAIYEVKSSSSDVEDDLKGNPKADKYAADIAFQKWVFEHLGSIKITGTYLVCIDSDYVLDGDLDITRLFKVIDMSEKVAHEYAKLEAQVRNAHKILRQKEAPSVELGEHCMSPYKCDFWEYCTRECGVPEKSVFNMYRMPFKKKINYYSEGKVSFEDLSNEKLSSNQFLQINAEESINKDGITEFLNTLSYPLYFLDFETMQLAIPEYIGTKPYQQIPFQYSLHYIKSDGGELKHKEFLGESGKDPRRALAEQLCRDIPKNVCTVAYNKGFECGRIRELASAYPDLAHHLLNIEQNIVDLLTPFQQGYYYLPQMGGSFSIKVVLPALFPNDPELDYHNLDSRVQNGGDAMSIYPKIKDMTPDEQEATRKALLEYCKLDTLAMVKIWQKLIQTIK